MISLQNVFKPSVDSTECRCAATNEIIGYSPLHSEEDLTSMLQNARQGQIIWGKLSVSERVQYISKIRTYLVEHCDEIAEIICRDNGKTRNDALVAEIFPAILAINYYCKKAPGFLRDESLKSGHLFTSYKRSKIVRVPWGVVAVISPWNYPFAIPFSEVIMALLAGNAVILKTATQTQMVGLVLNECLKAADLPAGVFSFINLPGSKAGDLLLENGVDKLFFTGSVPVGQYLMRKAADTLTPLSLELGGNDAMLVCDDADPRKAAIGAVWAGLSNAGQSCGGVERVYVHEAVYDPFMQQLKTAVESLQVGFGMDFNMDMGAMTTKNQISVVKAHLEDALAKGAVIYAQSKVPQNPEWQSFLPAMILTNVNHDMLIMQEETFGPVIAVMKVNDMEEAIRLANDSDLGLSASVWSRSHSKAEDIARRIEAGAVNINDHLMSHGLAETPWGGFKKSSIGRTHGKIGFDEMTQPQVIVWEIMPGAKQGMWWPPNNETIYKGIKGIIELCFAPGLGRRLAGLINFLKIVPRMFK
ncbi:MAG: aldehyde dehydrogenase family protein [Actinobacteria bacterium]|nr:aldehyde dehydrogenase family protein [Actinomycetota bacterium]